ncbi:MAG: ABC transporter ATP-binding protein [Kiritimatiellia bacterium]
MMRDIRSDAMANLTRLDPSFYRNEHTGDIMNRMNTDVKAVGDMVGQGLMNVSRAFFAFGISMVIMFRENARLAWLMLILLPVMTGISFVLILLLRKRYEASQEQFDRISSFSQENFTGVRVVKGFGIEDRQAGLFRDLNREYIRRNLAFSRIEAPIWPLITFMFSASSVLLLWVGGRQVLAGELTLGTLVQFLQYLTFLQWPVLALGWTLGLFIRGIASWKRLAGVLGTAPLIDDAHARPDAPAAVTGDIAFDHVSLQLGSTRVLDDVSLVIPAGRTIALTGPTGCGKTSLASLLVRLADPTSGRVTAGGRDLREFPLPVLRASVRSAPQEPFLFSDTIGRNLAVGAPGARSKPCGPPPASRIDEEIERFPNGYDTLVGERGVTLSGGQRQRVPSPAPSPAIPASSFSTTPSPPSTPTPRRPSWRACCPSSAAAPRC